MNRKCCRAEVGFWRKTSGVGGLCRGGGGPLYVFWFFSVLFFLLRLWKCLCFNKQKKKRTPQSYYFAVACRRSLTKLSKVCYTSCCFTFHSSFRRIWILRKCIPQQKPGRLAIYLQCSVFSTCTPRELSGKLTQAHHKHPLCSSGTHRSCQIKFLQSVSFRDFEIMTEPSFNGGVKIAKLSWIIIDFKLRQTIGFRRWLTELLSYACVSRCVI